MKLIEYKDYKIVVSDEALLVKPIRDLFNKDTSENKEKFMQQMSYMYFMIDPRSTYNYIIDDNERSEQIIIQEGLPKNFKPSKDLQQAMEIYKKHVVTTSYLLLEDTKICIDNLRKFLRNIDFDERDERTGKPIHTINTVTAALDKIPTLAQKLAEVEKIVYKEIEEAGRARGGNESKHLFEEGF